MNAKQLLEEIQSTDDHLRTLAADLRAVYFRQIRQHLLVFCRQHKLTYQCGVYSDDFHDEDGNRLSDEQLCELEGYRTIAALLLVALGGHTIVDWPTINDSKITREDILNG